MADKESRNGIDLALLSIFSSVVVTSVALYSRWYDGLVPYVAAYTLIVFISVVALIVVRYNLGDRCESQEDIEIQDNDHTAVADRLEGSTNDKLDQNKTSPRGRW